MNSSLNWASDDEVITRIQKRCKKPPEHISTIKQAREVWQNYQKYKAMADGAFMKYMQQDYGTNPQRLHHNRWIAYDGIVESWSESLTKWFNEVVK
jgi:hypothetical protein